MVIARNVDAAMKYKTAFDAYLRERKSPYQAIVAFSGKRSYLETRRSTTSSFRRHIPDASRWTGGIEPNHRYLLEVDSVVMPADGVIPLDAEMCWTADSLAMAKSKTSTRVEKSPGYYVDAETEQAMVHCLEETLLVDLEQAKVKPYSDVDRAKIGKRVSQHPLHETFLGSQLTEPSHRDAYYAEANKSAFIAELDLGADESFDLKDELKRLQRVFTSPVAELRQGWRKHAEALRPKEKEARKTIPSRGLISMSDQASSFGKVLREKRMAADISLRQFAEQLGASATYLSQVEQCNTPPPTAERIQHMAQLLNVDADPLLALAGRIPDDLAELIHRHPVEIPRLIRTVAEWSADEVARLNANIESARG